MVLNTIFRRRKNSPVSGYVYIVYGFPYLYDIPILGVDSVDLYAKPQVYRQILYSWLNLQ